MNRRAFFSLLTSGAAGVVLAPLMKLAMPTPAPMTLDEFRERFIIPAAKKLQEQIDASLMASYN